MADINIDYLITEGQAIRDDLIFVKPPSRGWRSYDEYELKDSSRYFTWVTICSRFLTQQYPSENLAQNFQASADSFEQKSNHFCPKPLEKMIGILKSCRVIPSDHTMQHIDTTIDDEVSFVEKADAIYQSYDYGRSNSTDCIKAYHSWYSEACVLFSKFFKYDNFEYQKFREIDNSCNGYGLHHNYHVLQASYNILLAKIKFGAITRLDINQQMDNNTSGKITKQPLLFISHASDDMPVVEVFVSMLQKIGFNKTNLFCSSIEGYGIDEGSDIYDTLRKKFIETQIYVVFILSENYYQSPACLNEMGAAWVLQSEYSTVVVPGFDIPNIKGAINLRKIAMLLGDDRHIRSTLNKFRERLVSIFKLTDLDDDIVWENHRNAFIESVNSLYKNTDK